MRDLVLAMMTTIDGRLDDPNAWISGIGDDVYTDIDSIFEDFDTILIGSATYAEMVEYWPNAEKGGNEFSDSNAAINMRMARKMNSYQKYIFSRKGPSGKLGWNNAEQVRVGNDQEIVGFVRTLKAQPGKKIQIAGGARLAQTFIRLGLLDELAFIVHPVVSGGARWFDQVDRDVRLDLVGVAPYQDGVVRTQYRPATQTD